MAKIFVPTEPTLEPEYLPEGKEVSQTMIKFLVGFSVVIMILFIIIIVGEKKGIDKDKEIMGLEKQVIMQNGNILTKQVKYETSKKIDPKDTSDIFFEVINGNDNFQEGDLVKFNHRFIELQQLEGQEYCVIDPSQIQFKINKEDVKADLLKR